MPIPNYALDLTATAPGNHITGEIHVITTPQSMFFVPVGGPFYTQSLILRNNVTNAVLFPNTDFKILQHCHEASQASGKNVCAIVYITNPLIASVSLEYQCVGGVYSNTSDLIRQMIVDHPLDPNAPQTISWGQLFGQPDQYPPAAHLHLANQFFGYGDLVAAIEQVRTVIASGDAPAFAAIQRYIQLVINNNNYITAADLNSIVAEPIKFTKVHATYAALRGRDDATNIPPCVYITLGQMASTDGRGMIFRWDPASTAPDDNHHVLRPDHILETDPGRFVSHMWAENALAPLVATLGRRINPDGIIDTRIAAMGHTNGADLNTVVTSGVHWVDSTCAHRPAGFDNGMLYVERADENYVFQRLHGGHNVPLTIDNTGAHTDYTEHVRIGIRPTINDPYVWSDWESMLTKRRGRLNGIDAYLAETNIAGPNLNTHARTGVHWVESYQANRAFSWGILKVTTLNSTDTIQEMYNKDNYAIRYGYGGTDYAGHTWSDWQFRANRNGNVDQTFAMYSHPSNLIDPTHGINAWYLSTQFAAPLWLRLTNAGIDADLAVTNNVDGMDLDDILNPCEVYYTTSTANRPSPYGLLKVWRESWNIVYQLAHSSDNNLHYRYGSFYSGIWHWSAWSRSATAAEMTSAISSATASVITAKHGGLGYSYELGPGDWYWQLEAGETIRIIIFGGGGGGGGREGAGAAGAGGDTVVYVTDGTVALAHGGGAGSNGYGAEQNIYYNDDPVRTGGDWSREIGLHSRLWATNDTSRLPSAFDSYGDGGPRDPYTQSNYRVQSNGGKSGMVDFEYCNYYDTFKVIHIVVGYGGSRAIAEAGDGAPGKCIILRGR